MPHDHSEFLFEHLFVSRLEVVIGKRAENGAQFSDVLDEQSPASWVGKESTVGSLHGVKVDDACQTYDLKTGRRGPELGAARHGDRKLRIETAMKLADVSV